MTPALSVKKSTLLLLILSGLLLAGFTWWFFVASQTIFPRAVKIGGEEYTLEIAATNATRALGLGGRDQLCTRCGMLFIFDAPARQSFWMRGMRFPLDIVWLSGDTIVHIERQVSQESEAVYRPEAVADRVLELNAGTTDTLEVGRRVQFLFPSGS